MTLEIDMVTAGIFTGQRQTGPTDAFHAGPLC